MNELCSWAHAFHLGRGLCVLWGGLGCFGRPGGSVRARLQGCCRERGSAPACPPWPAATRWGGRCLHPCSCPAQAAELLERFCLCGVTGTSPRILQITWKRPGSRDVETKGWQDQAFLTPVLPAWYPLLRGCCCSLSPPHTSCPSPGRAPPGAVASSWQRSRLLAASRSPRPSHR